MIFIGTDLSQIHFSKIAFAIVVLDLSLIGTAIGHLVNVSIIVNTYTFPFVLGKIGPQISIAIVSFGCVDSAASVIPALMGLGVFRRVHAKHPLTHRWTSFLMPGQ